MAILGTLSRNLPASTEANRRIWQSSDRFQASHRSRTAIFIELVDASSSPTKRTAQLRWGQKPTR
jgi:hypothetical protein